MEVGKGIIGIPTTDIARHSVFYEMLMSLRRPDTTLIQQVRGASVAENRNTVIALAKRRNYDWVFFLDDDMIVPADTLERLLSRPAVPVLSALYIARIAPFPPLAFKRAEANGAVFKEFLCVEDIGVKPVAAVGAGAMLVRREVWERLDAPWFTLGQLDAEAWGDDLHFCKKVRDAGMEVMVDYDTVCGHMGTVGVWPEVGVDNIWHTIIRQNDIKITIPAATAEEGKFMVKKVTR